MKDCSGIYSIVTDLKAFNILIFNPVISFCDYSQKQSWPINVFIQLCLVYHIWLDIIKKKNQNNKAISGCSSSKSKKVFSRVQEKNVKMFIFPFILFNIAALYDVVLQC